MHKTALLLGSLLLGGVTSASPAPLHTVIVVDTTTAHLTALRQQAVLGYLVRQRRDDTLSVLIACGKGVNTVYEGAVGEKLRLFTTLNALLVPCKAQGSPLTTALEQASAALGEYPRSALLIITDGGLSDDPRAANFGNATKRLAAVPGVAAVWVAGAAGFGGLRSSLKERLRPALGQRLVVSGTLDLTTGLAAFAAKLNP